MRPTCKHTLLAVGFALLMALAWCAALTQPARADGPDASTDDAEILAVYDAFRQAQNARDTDAIGAFFIDEPPVLWVSDGRSYRGRDVVLERMGSFQQAEHWMVLPELASAEIIRLGTDTAILHMPLVLQIGAADAPNTLGFLVNLVFHEVGTDWKIAALLTTEDKRAR